MGVVGVKGIMFVRYYRKGVLICNRWIKIRLKRISD